MGASEVDDVAAESARQLGALVDAIDRGEIEAQASERAYLAGARDALARLTDVDPPIGHT